MGHGLPEFGTFFILNKQTYDQWTRIVEHIRHENRREHIQARKINDRKDANSITDTKRPQFPCDLER